MNITEYVVKTPLIVTRLNTDGCTMFGIPEGGCVGFDGTHLYEKSSVGWSRLKTPKNAMIEWLEKHHVEKKIPTAKTHAIEAIIQASKKVKEANIVTVATRPVEV